MEDVPEIVGPAFSVTEIFCAGLTQPLAFFTVKLPVYVPAVAPAGNVIV